MPGTQPTLTNDGPIPQAWAATGQAIGSLGAQTSASALQTNGLLLDEYQNTVKIEGALNQVITAGAGWDFTVTPPAQGNAIPGVQIGTGIGGFGIGVPSGDSICTTCTILDAALSGDGPWTITVASALGLEVGMMIGATDWQYGQPDPANNTYGPALTPGTAISAIDGTTISLSDPALIAGTGLYCVAMAAWKNLVEYFTANVVS